MLKSIREDETKGLNVEVVSKDPISPKNGRVWHNTSDGKLKIRIAGVTRLLAYYDEVPSGEVTWDDIIGPKPPVDATRNKSFIQPDEPLVGMKEGDYWFKTGREPALGVGRPSFEVYQYDGTKWVKSCFSELGEMYGQIITDQIAPGTVLPEQLFVVDWYPSGLTWQNNTPSAGYVTWSDFKLTYNGTSHDVVTGNTNLEYIWWDLDNPTILQVSATLPTLAADDCLVAVNDGGTAFQILQATSLHGGSFLPETITETKIGPDAITSPKISANAIIAEKIAADAIISGKIAAGAVIADKIGANAVIASKIQAGAVLAEKLAADSVTANKIIAGAIETDKLAEFSIIADKIATNAVVAGKIATGAVVAEKLGIFDWVPSGLTWTDNSPSAGYVAWSDFSLCFEGTNHSIPAGNTNLKYLWWDETSPTVLQTSATKPTLMAEDCLVCINEEGTARQILQATLIHGGSILTHSITADEIKAGTITADEINMPLVDALLFKNAPAQAGADVTASNSQAWDWISGEKPEIDADKTSDHALDINYYGLTPPGTPSEGWLWVDTSLDPVELKKYESGTWKIIATLGSKWSDVVDDNEKMPADNATKNKTWVQSDPPSGVGESQGDIWIDSGTGTPYIYDGSGWKRVTWAVVSSDPDAPVDNATKNDLVRQATEPNPADYSAGDMWVDSDNGNPYIHDGSVWCRTTWATIGSDPNAPVDNATKNVDFVQATEPTGTRGDLWINTTDNSPYIHDGTAWRRVTWDHIKTDTGAPEDNATQNIDVVQATEPNPANYSSGDMWINTSENAPYIHDGTAWRRVSWAVIKTDANAPDDNADVTADNSQPFPWLTGTIGADQIAANTILAGMIKAGEITADRINLSNLESNIDQTNLNNAADPDADVTTEVLYNTSISAGRILLSSTTEDANHRLATDTEQTSWNNKPENMDELGEGTTYKRVKATDISAGHIKLTSYTETSSSYRLTNDTEKSTWNGKPDNMDEIGEGSTYQRVRATQIDSGYLKLTSSTRKSGEWYNEHGVEIDAAHGINIYGTDNALTTRATKTGTIQCKVDSSGKIIAGAGNIEMDSSGLRIKTTLLKFYSGTTYVGALAAYNTTLLDLWAVRNLILDAAPYDTIFSSSHSKLDFSPSEWMDLPLRTGDPTGTKGRIYFNTVENTIKVFVDSWWHVTCW